MISNPINPFINGSETREFIYEGGSKLYHFCPRKNGSRSYTGNMVFFANDHLHALDVFKRMLKHKVVCNTLYAKSKGMDSLNDDTKSATILLTMIDNGLLILEEAPTNQFYKVGWAGNDTTSFIIE